MRCFVSLMVIMLPALSAWADEPDETAPRSVGQRRELFVDHDLIDSLVNVRQVLHEPHDEGVVFRFDQPWEGPFSGYVSVLQDGDKYRLYYRGLPVARHTTDVESLCVAESDDGITWTRPALDIVKIEGKPTNILVRERGMGTHAFGPFIDTNPEAKPEERYKAIGTFRSGGRHVLVGMRSPDGIHWEQVGDEPIITDGAFDSQNVGFWSESENCYLCYGRTWRGGVRRISRWTSPDFKTWSKATEMQYVRGPEGKPATVEHLYTNQTAPYFRAPHIYLGTAARFMPGRKVITAEEAEKIGVHPRYFGDTSDSVLISTRGGNEYDRTFLGALIKPGIGPENWVSRTNYPALNFVQTGPSEMSLYVNQQYGQPSACLRRYSWRLDGVASLRAPGGEQGVMITKPMTFAGDELTLNFATSAAGEIRVEVQTPGGDPIPGFLLQDCRPIIGNELARAVKFQSGKSLGELSGQPVRLRFVMTDADLYSLKFEPAAAE